MEDFSYRNTEICPHCGSKLNHFPSYEDEVWGHFIEVEYGLVCDNCGCIDYYTYGNWEHDISDMDLIGVD